MRNLKSKSFKAILIFILLFEALSCSNTMRDVTWPSGENIGGGCPEPCIPEPCPDCILPGLNILSFVGAAPLAYKAGTHTIKWLLKPIDVLDEGLYSTKIEYSKDGGTSWTTMVESVPSVGDKEITYNWVVPDSADWEGDQFKIRLTTNNTYGGSYSKESDTFAFDNQIPQIDTSSLRINGSSADEVTIIRNFMKVNFSATDTITPITDVCIKTYLANRPNEDDVCWKPLKFLGYPVSKSVIITDIDAFVGFISGVYDLHLWVKDAAGNISGEALKTNIRYRPATPPKVSNVIASNMALESGGTIIGRGNLVSNTGAIYIYWRIEPNADGYDLTNPITLRFSLDEKNYQTIVDGLQPSASNCQFDQNTFTGCYRWEGSNIPATSNYFRVRVVAKNSAGLIAANISEPFNTGSFRSMAGSTDFGLGSSAQSMIFFYDGGSTTEQTDHQRFVVTRAGRLYIRDNMHGVVVIDPSDSSPKEFVKKSTNNAERLTGTLFKTTTTSEATIIPKRIALDYQENILVLERDRIWKIEPSGNMTPLVGVEETKKILKQKENADWIGNNGLSTWFPSTSEQFPKGPLTYVTLPPGATSESGDFKYGCFKDMTPGIPADEFKFDNNEYTSFIWPLPNGDFFFSVKPVSLQSLQSEISTQPYYAYYKAKDSKGNDHKRVYPLRLCGVGANGPNYANSQEPYRKLNDLLIWGVPGISFSRKSGTPDNFALRVCSPDPKPPATRTDCVMWGVNFHPRTGQSRGANTIYPPVVRHGTLPLFPSRLGQMHAIHWARGLLKYNPSYNRWDLIVGYSEAGKTWINGQCEDTTPTKCPADNSYVDLQDAFITEDNVIYIMDRGRIRAVTEDGNIVTLFGQSRNFGDGGIPQSARFGKIDSFGVSGNDDRIVIVDDTEKIMRELTQGVVIQKIAGKDEKVDSLPVLASMTLSNGTTIIQNVISNELPNVPFMSIWWGWSFGIGVDRNTGEIWATSNPFPSTNRYGPSGIARVFKDEGKVYGQMTAYPQPSTGTFKFMDTGALSCDGKSASLCKFVDANNRYSHIAPIITAFGTDFKTSHKNLLVTNWVHDGTFYRSCYAKILRLPAKMDDVFTTTGSSGSLVQHFFGKPNSASASEQKCLQSGAGVEMPSDGTLMRDRNEFSFSHSGNINGQFMTEEDSVLVSWRGSRRIVKVPIMRDSNDVIVGAGTLQTLAWLPKGVVAFNYKSVKDANNQVTQFKVFYCGTDSKLYRYTLVPGADTVTSDNMSTDSNGKNIYKADNMPTSHGTAAQLTLPPGIQCSTDGEVIEFNKLRTSFYFVYKQNQMTGVGEYLLPSEDHDL
jgi:hypothetical protein